MFGLIKTIPIDFNVYVVPSTTVTIQFDESYFEVMWQSGLGLASSHSEWEEKAGVTSESELH